MARVIALDHGEARCGVAVSDPTGALATPLAAVERPDTRRGLSALAGLVRERDAERVVVGLPLTLAGEEGAQAARGRFLRRLPGRILALAFAAVVVVAVWFLVSLYQPGKGDGSGRVPVTIPRGNTLDQIADRLDRAGVVSSSFFFKLRV